MRPPQRTLAWLRAQDYLAAVVECWNPHTGIRQHLFGVLDPVAVCEGETVGVQATSRAKVAARVAKLAEHESMPRLRAAGLRQLVVGWRKNSAGRWTERVVDVS
jgi:hypothetical protein